MTDRPGDGQIRAAGAVVWRPAAEGVQVALIRRRRYGGDWTFPKGKCEPGEHVLVTAVREVAEETGLEVILGRPLGQSRYDSAKGPKRVDYWAGRCLTPERPFAPNDEADELAWLTGPAARQRLTYPRDAERLDAFAAGPARTVPLVLLRHAEAGSKADWPGADLGRPLDSAGLRTASELAGVLRCLGPTRVISSAAERCLATVRPYAELARAKVETEPLFTAGPQVAGPAASPATAVPAAAAAAAAIAADGVPTVICTHRENLPLLLEAACAQLGSGPPAGPELGKGGFWVLQSADGALVSAERHGPPEDGPP